MNIQKSQKYCVTCIRWSARILAGLLAAFLLFFVLAHAFSPAGLPNPLKQPAGVQIEFASIFAIWLGCVLAWKWQGFASLLVLTGVIIFHIVEGTLWFNWLFGLFGLTGVLLLLSWLLERTAIKTRIKMVKIRKEGLAV